MKATVYSVTTLHAAAEPFEKDLPFQIAIVEIAGQRRKTVRIEGPPVRIGDEVIEVTPQRFRAVTGTLP
ncbi:MAG: OB-fold domain-containing protein [Bryobacterales bacterium]|nr:OB-fold domain-containing protein [Bryobacterales bacterium]